jgi:hypothetical protein
MTGDLVTVDEAAGHLREVLDGMPADKRADLDLKVAIASAAIVDYLKTRADPTWDDTTAPPIVKGAVLSLLGAYWEHRGDDDTSGNNYLDQAWTGVELMLRRLRDPALA